MRVPKQTEDMDTGSSQKHPRVLGAFLQLAQGGIGGLQHEPKLFQKVLAQGGLVGIPLVQGFFNTLFLSPP